MTDWADRIAKEIWTVGGDLATDIAAALRKARADTLDEVIHILVNMDCPDESAPEVTYKLPWYDGVGAAEGAIRALRGKPETPAQKAWKMAERELKGLSDIADEKP